MSKKTWHYAEMPKCSGLSSHNEQKPMFRVPLQTGLRFHSRGYEQPPHQRACGITNSRWLAGDRCTNSAIRGRGASSSCAEEASSSHAGEEAGRRHTRSSKTKATRMRPSGGSEGGRARCMRRVRRHGYCSGDRPLFKGGSPHSYPQAPRAKSPPMCFRALPLRRGGWVPHIRQADPIQKEPNHRSRSL
jgi:hypothetical protein